MNIRQCQARSFQQRAPSARCLVHRANCCKFSSSRVKACNDTDKQRVTTSNESNPSVLTSLSLLPIQLFLAYPALAEDAIKYNSGGGSDFLKNATGTAYILLVCYFAYRVLSRRAKRATQQRIAGSGNGKKEGELKGADAAAQATPPSEEGTPFQALVGSLQLGVISYGLFIFSTKLSEALAAVDLPDGYTAHNVSVTVRTVLIGVSYLATFIFGANSAGLFGLSIQMAFFPESLKTSKPRDELPTGPQLPKVSLKSNKEEIRRAFQEAERLGRQEGLASRDIVEVGSGADSQRQ